MSCVSQIEILILDLDAFRKACVEMDMVFCEGQQTFRTYDGNRSCVHAAKLSDSAYELGLVRCRWDEEKQKVVADQEGDAFMVMRDTFGKGATPLINKVGLDCEHLMKSYACHAVRNKASQMGWSLTEEVQQDGSVLFESGPRYQEQQASGSW